MINTYKKDENIRTNFESIDDSDVINKALLDKKLAKIKCHISILEKDYNEFKVFSNKHSIEEILIGRFVKITIRKLYDKALFDGFPNADKVLKDFLFVERGRLDLKPINYDNVIQ